VRPTRRRLLRQLAGFGIIPAASRLAWAVDYPNRPIHLLNGFAPGGQVDIFARLLGQQLSDRLGQSFVVDSRPGAATNIATEEVVHAAPDGYTLLWITTANAVNASLYEKLNFNFIRDIAPVAGVDTAPLVMEVKPSFPAKTVSEFIAYAKANPGKLSIASSGIGTSLHLSGELFKAMAQIQFVHVPYRGSAPGLSDVMAGQIQGMFDNVTSSFELVQSGKLRALGVTTKERSQTLPDVPPIADTLSGFETSSFYGVGAPRGTPRDVVDLLNREINAAFDEPLIKQRFAELGAVPITGSASRFGEMLRAETARWRKVVELSGQRKE
jgi:tripartite-type tricarboxylate transporter receptor subunit TctC